ncbi:outer membrane lipoprotein-sorting protein [Myxococcota bacterium]
MNPCHVSVSLALLTCSLALANAARAGDDPRQLIDRVFKRTSWKDMHGKVRLELKNKRGDTKVREIAMWSLKNAKDETSMLMRFVTPADVRGTGFLLIEHDTGEDDRRLFLPALRRVQRISASGSGGSFMSSDFTYYDIGRPKLEDWSYRFVGGKQLQGVACKAVEGTAANDEVMEDTGYSRVIWYVDASRLVIVGAEYFDKTGMKLKKLDVLEIEEISGTPFATHMRVRDVNTGHQSDMRFSDLETNRGLNDKLFTERNLRRWRR